MTERLSDLSDQQRAWLQDRHHLYLLSRFGTKAQQSALAGMEDPYRSRQTLQEHLQRFEAATQVEEMLSLGESPEGGRSRSKGSVRHPDDTPTLSSTSPWCEQGFTITGGASPLDSRIPSLSCRMNIDMIWEEPLWQGLLFASLVMTLLLGSVWWWMIHRRSRRREVMNEKRYTRVA
ncbi:MAG: hypothetical protein M1823_005502 [Watsoniomyces obsoletus]|nr:MAG: hypothetical protein M1823_005502 [Watsoniomyces obsoletus]